MTTAAAPAEHVATISGQRYQGEGAYAVTCSCGFDTGHVIAYHRDAKRMVEAHKAQAAAGMA